MTGVSSFSWKSVGKDNSKLKKHKAPENALREGMNLLSASSFPPKNVGMGQKLILGKTYLPWNPQ